MDKSQTAPRRLLQSRRFWSSIISIVTLIIAATRPELEEHLDLPRSRVYARARTYYDTTAEVAERFIAPLSRIKGF